MKNRKPKGYWREFFKKNCGKAKFLVTREEYENLRKRAHEYKAQIRAVQDLDNVKNMYIKVLYYEEKT